MHRPSNVDDPKTLATIFSALIELGRDCPLILPAHPRTQKMLMDNNLEVPADRVKLLDPIGYLDFVKLMMNARLVLTDSGGIQEETTVLGIPCLTIRENTERPITIEIGTNRLVGMNANRIIDEGREALAGRSGTAHIPQLWDGKASERIVRVIDEYLS